METGAPKLVLVLPAAAALIALIGGLRAAFGQAPEPEPLPAKLSETGLFAPGSATEIDPRNRTFVPQYPLWSDGATKRRWIRLPEGRAIDARDPDAWQFPVGTRFWKEFSFEGRRVETRYSERLPDGSVRFASYVWSADGRDAQLAPSGGAQLALASGQVHDVPAQSDCLACHEGRGSRVLGFNALQLSSDRDPNALHREPVPHDALDLDELIASGLLEGLPSGARSAVPRITARSARERAALGYLYGNCSGCHNDHSAIAALGMSFDQTLSHNETSAPLLTTLNVPSTFVIPNEQASLRIAPGRSEASALAYRMSTRFPAAQMPPLGTRIVDHEALALMRAWISNELISNDLPEVGKEERETP